MPMEAAVQLKNINPLGAVDLYLLGIGRLTLQAGEVFEVPDDVGTALLEQVGNYTAAAKTEAKAATVAADKAALAAEEAVTA
jgi:hypothetical protein